MKVDTPPPLNEAATLRPSIIMRPSLARPPLAVKNVMNGRVIAPWFTVLSTIMPGTAVRSAP